MYKKSKNFMYEKSREYYKEYDNAFSNKQYEPKVEGAT